ncbi:MAG: hydroxymethylbilane synthase, partial [Bacteroidota bacterium]
DKIQHLSFDKMEGKGFFTKEIETALLNGTIDLAVHSYKDLETTPPAGLTVAAVSAREDPSELLLVRPEAVDAGRLFSLAANAVVGTSSARRKMQLLELRGDVTLKDLRGNVPTRVQKLRDGNYDAIVLARAGVTRLNLDLGDLHVETLDPFVFVPAPAQGVLALQIRSADKELHEALQPLNHADVQACIGIERKVLNLFDGGCQLPLGVYCLAENGQFRVRAAVADQWDAYPHRLDMETENPEGFPERIVAALRGARKRVFITRDLEAGNPFKKALDAAGFRVHCRSLIDIRQQPLAPYPKIDWIFFSSRNAVAHFLAQQPEVGEARLGAIGAATAAALQQHGHQPQFVGEGGDTAAIAAAFAQQAGSGTVLFPQSAISLRTVQQALPADQVVDRVVYDTQPNASATIPSAEVVVLTSPSNVHAYLAQRAFSPGQQLVSIGPATSAALAAAGYPDHHVAAAPDPAALAATVLAL